MNYIVDDIGTVIASIREKWVSSYSTEITADDSSITVDGGSAPYYMYGHTLEVASRLLLKNKTFQKYPLFCLVLDTPERKREGIVEYSLNIGILAFTKSQYNAEQRYEQVFKPVLYPLYKLFLEELKESGLFMWPGDLDFPEHTKYDRPFYGTSGRQKNEKYIFNDPLDAIEIVDLRINQTIKCN